MYIGLYLQKPIIKPGCYPILDEKYIKKYRTGNLEQSIKIGQFFFDNVNDVENFMKKCKGINDEEKLDRKLFSQDYKRFIYNY